MDQSTRFELKKINAAYQAAGVSLPEDWPLTKLKGVMRQAGLDPSDYVVTSPLSDPRCEALEEASDTLQRLVHDSRSPSDRETVKGAQAEPLFDFDDPPPLRWKVAGLVPEGFITVLAADGGTGKSYFAIFLSLCVALGRALFGLGVNRGRVLYVDYELDLDEQRRRVARVARGIGVSVDDERLRDRIYYTRPGDPLGTSEAHEHVLTLIDRYDIDLVVLDSLTVGSAGSDVTASEDVVPVMQRFCEWGTVFAIDHVSSASARGNASRARPFGSVFKRNIARSTFTLAQADAGGYLLQPDKNNFAAKQDLVTYDVDFGDDMVRFKSVDVTDDAMAGALADLSTHEVTFTAVKSLYGSSGAPVPVADIVAWRDDHEEGIAAGTVRNHLTVLKRRGKIETTAEGHATPTSASFTIHDSIRDHETVNGAQNGYENGSVRRESAIGGIHGDRDNSAPAVNTGDRVATPKFNGTVKEVGWSETHNSWRIYVQPKGRRTSAIRAFMPEDVEVITS